MEAAISSIQQREAPGAAAGGADDAKKNHQSGTTDFGLFPIKAPDTRARQRQSIRHKRMQMCELRRVRQ